MCEKGLAGAICQGLFRFRQDEPLAIESIVRAAVESGAVNGMQVGRLSCYGCRSVYESGP